MAKKPGSARDEVEHDRDREADHGQPVAAERPPHQLPLRGDRERARRVPARRCGTMRRPGLFQPDARIDQRQQDVADQRADQRERADQQHEGAGEIHVLRHQRFEEERRRRRRLRTR